MKVTLNRLRDFALVLGLLLGVAPAAAPASVVAFPVAGVGDFGMTVSDMDRAVAFYVNVLTFRKLSDQEIAGTDFEELEGVFGARARIVRLQLGQQTIALTSYLTPPERPIPNDSTSNDRWFQHIAIVVSDMGKAYAHLRAAHVTYASPEPQTLPPSIPAAAGISAFYFKDPDGHALEILHFPPDKGSTAWRAGAGAPLFLGIDHSAIVVADTNASLRFYVDQLGFTVAGVSDNFGTEQEHLNNVFGARLHITTLRAATGPGIELLEYLTPRSGRPIPGDERATDIAHWQTQLVEPDASAAYAAALASGDALVSPRAVDVPATTLDFTKGFLLRDPDSHVMEVIQR
ncbi:MAG: VOC family protein [Vulcanimicrobiaceae bacterium]